MSQNISYVKQTENGFEEIILPYELDVNIDTTEVIENPDYGIPENIPNPNYDDSLEESSNNPSTIPNPEYHGPYDEYIQVTRNIDTTIVIEEWNVDAHTDKGIYRVQDENYNDEIYYSDGFSFILEDGNDYVTKKFNIHYREIDDIKLYISKKIEETFTNEIYNSIGEDAVTSYESKTWTQQLDEALEYNADNTVETKLIDSILDTRPKYDKQGLVDKIIEKSNSYKDAIGKIIGKKQHKLDLLDAVTTVEELQAIGTDDLPELGM